MADMIDSRDAKAQLNCDDATLQSYINNGTIRAQKVGGKLMCHADDVAKLASGKSGDDDGTIVLTGDSDDLSIDLGKVGDDSAATQVSGQSNESITFGGDLEVVSFDDNQGTSELNFDDTKPTQSGGKGLSFTDSNTAVMTAVDETSVGATTAPLDFQTNEQPAAEGNGASARRSVRSNRSQIMEEEEPAHWIWSALLCVALVVGTFFVLPYYIISTWPKEDEKQYAGGRATGVDDSAWTRMAGGIVGFSVEPNKEKFAKNGGDGWQDLKQFDGEALWRYHEFRGEFKGQGERVESLVITEVNPEGTTAKSTKTSYPVVEKKTQIPGSDNAEPITELSVQIFKGGAGN